MKGGRELLGLFPSIPAGIKLGKQTAESPPAVPSRAPASLLLLLLKSKVQSGSGTTQAWPKEQWTQSPDSAAGFVLVGHKSLGDAQCW